MGLKHEAKKGTVIEVNGVTITVLRGSPQLEISAPPEVAIKMDRVNHRKRRPPLTEQNTARNRVDR